MSADTTAEKRTMEFSYNSSNPFLSGIVEYVEETNHRKLIGHSIQDVVDKPTGVTVKQKILVLGEKKVIDTQEFTKVYMGELRRFFGMSKKTLHLLDYIMSTIRYGEDRICLYYPDVKEKTGLIKTTMYSSIKQMLRVNILAKANTPGCYYINPAVVFKGERITIVMDYVRDHIPNEYEADTMQDSCVNEETMEANVTGEAI